MSEYRARGGSMFHDIGVLGIGLWEGEAIGNDFFGPEYLTQSQVRDPYKGQAADDGTARIAGMDLPRAEFARTIAAVGQSFQDPYRCTRRRRFFPPDLLV